MRILDLLLNDTGRGPGRVFALVIQSLIVLSIVSSTAETIRGLSPQAIWWLNATEVVIVVVFTIEYLMRLIHAKASPKFVFSFFGLIDLVAILPFYLSLGLDLRSVRALRLMRLFRILKVGRYNSAIDRFRRAISLAREEVILFLSVAGILLYLSAVGIYYCERDAQPEKFGSLLDCLWWAIITLTTVGYGDVYPVTAAGKIFTFVILTIGISIVALPAGIIASALTEARGESEPQPHGSAATRNSRRE
jgi:voltage-gated potassium channel